MSSGSSIQIGPTGRESTATRQRPAASGRLRRSGGMPLAVEREPGEPGLWLPAPPHDDVFAGRSFDQRRPAPHPGGVHQASRGAFHRRAAGGVCGAAGGAWGVGGAGAGGYLILVSLRRRAPPPLHGARRAPCAHLPVRGQGRSEGIKRCATSRFSSPCASQRGGGGARCALASRDGGGARRRNASRRLCPVPHTPGPANQRLKSTIAGNPMAEPHTPSTDITPPRPGAPPASGGRARRWRCSPSPPWRRWSVMWDGRSSSLSRWSGRCWWP